MKVLISSIGNGVFEVSSFDSGTMKYFMGFESGGSGNNDNDGAPIDFMRIDIVPMSSIIQCVDRLIFVGLFGSKYSQMEQWLLYVRK